MCRVSPCLSRLDDHKILEARLSQLEAKIQEKDEEDEQEEDNEEEEVEGQQVFRVQHNYRESSEENFSDGWNVVVVQSTYLHGNTVLELDTKIKEI